MDPQRHGILHLWLRLLQAVQGRTHALRIPQYPDRRRCRKGGRPRPREDHAQPPRRSERLGGLLGAEARPRLRRFVQLLLLPPLGRARLGGRTGRQPDRRPLVRQRRGQARRQPLRSRQLVRGQRVEALCGPPVPLCQLSGLGRQRQLRFGGGRDAAHRRGQTVPLLQSPRRRELHARRAQQLLPLVRRGPEGTHAQRLHRPLQVRGRRHLPLVGKALRLGAGLPVHGAAPLAAGESLLHEVQGPARADGHGERRQQRHQHQRPGQLPPGRGAVGLVARNRVVHRGGQRHLLAEPHRELRRRTEG